jgi:hypothetical protein
MTPASIAFKARTGRAIVVVLAGDADVPQVLERATVPLLPLGEFAPYHAAEGLAAEAAHRHVSAAIDRARGLAQRALREAGTRCARSGHALRGCAVLVGAGMPAWTTSEILAVHVRMHQAEGELFRNVLVDAARALCTPLTTLPEKTALDAAAQRLGLTRSQLDATLAALGKQAGAPWGKDQKEAAAAAWVALQAATTTSSQGRHDAR